MSNLLPKERILILNEIQQEAVEAIEKNHFIGTVKIFTGGGKTRIIFKIIKRMFDLGLLKASDDVWILSEEVKTRKNTFFNEEIPAYKESDGINILNYCNLKFYSYNIGPKYTKQVKEDQRKKPVVVFADECDKLLTKMYHKSLLLIDEDVKFVGLTATLSSFSKVYTEQAIFDYQPDKLTRKGVISTDITKGQLLEIHIPVVYNRDMEYGLKKGVLSPFRTYLIEHQLSTDKEKCPVRITKKVYNGNIWIGSEKKYWDFWRELSRNPTIERGFRTTINKNILPNWLKSLKSKQMVGEKLISQLSGKTLIFGAKLDWLQEITENVARENVIDILNMLQNGAIETIASSKRLQRGVTISNLENLIIFLDSKKSDKIEQMIGRLIRYTYQKTGNVYIIYTKDTFEEKWIKEITKIRDPKGRVVGNINLNIIKTIPSRRLWNS